MQTIHDIRFSNEIYELATYWALLLHEREGVHIPIQLTHAPLMPFIRVFDNKVRCQNHIQGNLQKIVILFGYGDNMHQWLADHSELPCNLQEIKIFCHADDHPFVSQWARRHIQRLRNIKFDIIGIDKLNYKLLLFGADHLKQLHSDYEPYSPHSDQVLQDYKRVCRGLANYFWEEANSSTS